MLTAGRTVRLIIYGETIPMYADGAGLEAVSCSAELLLFIEILAI